MPGTRKEIPKDGAQNKYGGAARKIEIEAIGNMGLPYEYLFRKFQKEGR